MKKDGNDMSGLNDTHEEVLRRELISLKKEINALKSDNEILKRALSEEVSEKYRAYEKLARLS